MASACILDVLILRWLASVFISFTGLGGRGQDECWCLFCKEIKLFGVKWLCFAWRHEGPRASQNAHLYSVPIGTETTICYLHISF